MRDSVRLAWFSNLLRTANLEKSPFVVVVLRLEEGGFLCLKVSCRTLIGLGGRSLEILGFGPCARRGERLQAWSSLKLLSTRGLLAATMGVLQAAALLWAIGFLSDKTTSRMQNLAF